MSRPIGLSKSGGRLKGTPNRKTQELSEIFLNLNFNTPQKIIEILPKLSPEKQVDVCLKLMEFEYPKRKMIESSQQATAHDALMEVIRQRREQEFGGSDEN